MSFKLKVRIRFVDTDASGRIHYTAMFRYFEAAEFEFLRSHGVEYGAYADYGFPRVHVECDYTGTTKVDDVLEIGVEVEKVGNSSFTLAYTAKSGELPVASGKITVVCLSKTTGRPVALPDSYRKALTEI